MYGNEFYFPKEGVLYGDNIESDLYDVNIVSNISGGFLKTIYNIQEKSQKQKAENQINLKKENNNIDKLIDNIINPNEKLYCIGNVCIRIKSH